MPLRFFWPPWSAVIKRLQISFLGLPTNILGILGLLIYRQKGLEKYLSNGVLHAPKKFEITVAKQEIKTCSHLETADQGGQKNRNGNMTAVLFHNAFC